MTTTELDSPQSEGSGVHPLGAVRLSFIGCGVMAEAIMAGLLKRRLVLPGQIIGSHPALARRDQLEAKYGIEMVEDNRAAAVFDPPGEGSPTATHAHSLVILAVKPQRLATVLGELKGELRQDQLLLSIVAGARTETIGNGLLHPSIVRAMPNTPAQIGEGITVWTATTQVTDAQRVQVSALLGALGREMAVEEEKLIDMATALSATGPTYIFLVMEALIDAGVHLGFSRHMAHELVIQTMLGAVLFARESQKHPAELRNMVTSPGGTSAEAIYQMEKGGLRTVLSKAVWAAYQRAVSLGAAK